MEDLRIERERERGVGERETETESTEFLAFLFALSHFHTFFLLSSCVLNLNSRVALIRIDVNV